MENLFINNLFIENAKEEADRLTIAGYCCHFDKVNLNSEIVDEDSFKTFFSMYDEGKIAPKLNYNHDNQLIIGSIDEIISDKTGLYMTAHLNRGVKINDEMIIPNVLNKTLDQFSTEGFIKDGYNGIIEHEDGSYYVKNFILTMVAIVPTPADPDAKFSLVNYINDYAARKAEEKKEIEKNSRKVFLLV